MIAIHSIAGLTAKVSSAAQSNWVTLTLIEPDGATMELTLYFTTRRRGFEEENRFARELAEAINAIKPIDVGNWASSEPTQTEEEFLTGEQL